MSERPGFLALLGYATMPFWIIGGVLSLIVEPSKLLVLVAVVLLLIRELQMIQSEHETAPH